MLTTICLIGILIALVWNAVETYRVHKAIDAYAQVFQVWSKMLERVELHGHGEGEC